MAVSIGLFGDPRFSRMRKDVFRRYRARYAADGVLRATDCNLTSQIAASL